ncbi:hypothetical protein GCM10007424_00230 [Flavobacterium suaedae]|uniref:CD-NTase-associated protein 16 NUDIX domain-containing protein n=1 Tax=Flavobacterium suaedae TaxID=1767027 RepID=A0ABQ1JBK9_9FLAO|nr:hypothetical protein [Flavobacterium suaedae]GGB64318.1 hypothetical protein GCM10007424_00230 [Flavobacterium suaedae]
MSAKGKVSFTLGGLGLVSCFFLDEGELKDTILKISLGLVIAVVLEVIIFLYEHRKKWSLIKTKFWKPNASVRITVAYLFRIETNGKYVLIKRHKNDFIGYQPVGGAYKYFKEENRARFDELGILPCNQIVRDEDTENDMRLIMNKRKKLVDFLKWFDSRKDREIDPFREFCEELIQPGILPMKLFPHIKYSYVGKHQEGILRTDDYPVDQFRHADIFELRIESEAQKQAILDLAKHEEIIFATAEEIKKGTASNGIRILPHTFKILPK